ncbi:glycosyltransferase family A protein [Gramella sp. AN32]|uniref:Glycosyltransferase family 2 protein n=1 Tax=Christiangramia antarctica TaxID=2058158 RepID=A0ABW5X8I0_9FLAO|nr:glycosyltransferase family A protein [Gramella sp. AN32]MCM4154697.1 glycosyltransferase family 2 protein [Gramella sp. AN32]
MAKSKITPVVSIIMATYNRLHYIEESLIAITNQSFKNWECIIIDDGSSDGTKEFLESFIRTDSRFKYYRRTNDFAKGLPGCRNMGLENAIGKSIVFFDDDDIAHPDCLRWSFEELVKNDADYCRYGRSVFFNNFRREFDRRQNYSVSEHNPLKVENMITGRIPFNSCQVLWRTEIFKNEKFNESLLFAEEWELYTRLLLKEPKGISIDKNLYFGRKHSESNTGEFKNSNSIRVKSKVDAAISIVNHLTKAEKFPENLFKFFIQMGFELQSYSLIKTVLNRTDAKLITKLKYKIGFIFYPLIRPLLKLKGKMIRA